MSREIIVRAFNAEYGMSAAQPVQHFFKTNDDWFGLRVQFGVGPDMKFIPVSDCTLLQSTGVHDRNNKPVFEGDVVQLYFYDSFKNYTHQFEKSQCWVDGAYRDDIKQVKFVFGSFVIWSDLIRDYRNFSTLARPGERIEVIGNIYENPELISA